MVPQELSTTLLNPLTLADWPKITVGHPKHHLLDSNKHTSEISVVFNRQLSNKSFVFNVLLKENSCGASKIAWR